MPDSLRTDSRPQLWLRRSPTCIRLAIPLLLCLVAVSGCEAGQGLLTLIQSLAAAGTNQATSPVSPGTTTLIP